MFDFRQPHYLIRDPDMIKQVAVTDFEHFENHKPFMDVDIDVLLVSKF